MITPKIEKYIDSVKWRFAKTYAETAPHEYTVRSWAPWKEDQFEHFVEFIRKHGVEEKFYSSTFTYWYHGPHKYWTMGNPVNETTVINRCLVSDYYPGTNIYRFRKKK